MLLYETDGSIKCEIQNWDGLGYKIPRNGLSNFHDKEKIKYGIYLLLGKNEKNENTVYIGESGEVFKRLKQHYRKDDPFRDFDEIIVFVSNGDKLNKTYVEYLESRLYEIAKEAKRYNVLNKSMPTKPGMKEEDISDMEKFINNITMITKGLGHKVFEKRSGKDREEIYLDSNESYNRFFIKTRNGIEAAGIPATGNSFIVFKGSKISKTTVPSYPNKYRQIRDKLLREGSLKEENGSLVFAKDYEFSSPSQAAGIVLGRSANGKLEWKSKDGTTLNNYKTID